jgi:hypothetical protein
MLLIVSSLFGGPGYNWATISRVAVEISLDLGEKTYSLRPSFELNVISFRKQLVILRD